MSNEISWHVEVAVTRENLEKFKILIDEMVASTQGNEPDTLIYEWHLSEDGTSAHSYETYAHSAAAMIHINAFADNFATRFTLLAEQTRLIVFGNPNNEVRTALSRAGGIFTTPINGFKRS